MCGRFNLTATAENVAQLFDLPTLPQLAPRYNIAPTQPVAAVRLQPDSQTRELTHFHWGLIPSWAKDTSLAARMINARSETVAEKPAFRHAFKRRRCLIPATGFYEWQAVNGRKQPLHIQRRDGGLMALAGLWEIWQGADGAEIASCTILTTQPNELLAAIHNRMPVILPPAEFAAWLDPATPPLVVQALLQPYPADELHAYPISTRVNSPHFDDPSCLTPLAA